MLSVAITFLGAAVLFLRSLQVLIDRNDVITRGFLSFISNEALVHLERKLLDIVDCETRNALSALLLGDLGKASDPNEECCFAYALLVLLREELEEVSDGRRAIECLFESHFFEQI